MSVRNIGSVLDGKYQILSRLGSGGMGEVYRVRHLHLDELRVIKVLRQDLVGDSTLARRFQQEARTATQIKHSNVAILYDYSQLADGSFYMVWEHIDGQDVGSWLRERGPFPIRLAVQLGIQTLHGLEAIHGAGVIHRDISPDNLMITHDRKGRYQVKIIDLGLAKALEPEAAQELTETGSFLGKMRYCSPEQAGDGPVELDQRSDLYSFAAVLYEMISGLPAFDSESAHGILIKRLAEDPLPLAGRNPEVRVPETLDAVVLKGLRRDREQRPADASSFIAELEKVASTLRQAAEAPAPTVAKPVRSPRPTEMSKAERNALLAQIDAAAARARSGSRLLTQADAAVDEGQLARARELMARLEESEPGIEGLAALKAKVAQAQHTEVRRQRAQEAEELVESYLKQRKGPLAQLALQTLIEIAPDHPRRAEYEKWVQLLDEEVEQQQRADAACAAGRAAVSGGDYDEARQKLEEVRDNDLTGQLAEQLEEALERAVRGAQQSTDLAETRDRLERCLAERDTEGAERHLATLSGLDVARVTVQDYRRQIDEIRGTLLLAAESDRLERIFRAKIEERDWGAARDAAVELSQQSSDRRGGELLSELSHLQDRERKAEALEAGIRQVEELLEAGQLEQGELALRIVLQMSPDHPRRAELEERLQVLRG